MEIFNTKDNLVTKIIHKDGSETAIKHVPTCYNEITDNFKEKYIKRDKFTVFISTSVGCYMKCSFCHLTQKKARYNDLTESQLISNLKEAIAYKLELNPELKNYYIKLSWMGMGDALSDPEKVSNVTIVIMEWLMSNNMVLGLDGVDLSTVFPKNVSKDFFIKYNELNNILRKYKMNPKNLNKKRTPFRLFYSIHNMNQDERKKIIPYSFDSNYVIDILNNNDINFNILYHYLFIDNVNDSKYDIELLKFALKDRIKKDNEFRILRYNSCKDSEYHESERFNEIVKSLLEVKSNIKVQISPGKEVQAACGQFIVSKFK